VLILTLLSRLQLELIFSACACINRLAECGRGNIEGAASRLSSLDQGHWAGAASEALQQLVRHSVHERGCKQTMTCAPE
jgi:hypothetical protein